MPGGTGGHHEHTRCARALGGSARRLGDVPRGDRLAGRPRARHLGAERRPFGSQRPREQLSLGVDHAHDREVGAGGFGRSAREGSERGTQVTTRGDLRSRPRE